MISTGVAPITDDRLAEVRRQAETAFWRTNGNTFDCYVVLGLIAEVDRLRRVIARHDVDREMGRCDGLLNSEGQESDGCE